MTRSGFAWLLAAGVSGCQTAAVFDVAGQEVLGFGIVGAQRSCDGEGQQLTLALTDQAGATVRIGGSRIPRLPASVLSALSFDETKLDGEPVTVELVAARAVTASDGQTYAVVLDRSGAACGTLPPGPWSERCNLEPCHDTDSAECSVERGCCRPGKVCVGLAGEGVLEEQCVSPSDDCDGGCGAGAVCRAGACVPQLRGALDPEDRWGQAAAGSVARLLDDDPEANVPAVSRAWALVSSGAGLQALTAAPASSFDPVGRAFERELLPPYGAPTLMQNLALLDTDGPVLVWAMGAGSGVLPDGRPPHLIVALDADSLAPADDAAFADAACATDGTYLRVPPDADVETLAGSSLPAAARSRVVYKIRLEPPPEGAGPHRFSGLVRLDVRSMVGDGSRPPVARLDHPFDLVLGGAR